MQFILATRFSCNFAIILFVLDEFIRFKISNNIHKIDDKKKNSKTIAVLLSYNSRATRSKFSNDLTRKHNA